MIDCGEVETADVSAFSLDEKECRQDAVRYAQASVRLEGFLLGEEAEALNRAYICGDLTSGQHVAAIRRLAGLEASS